MKKCLSLIIVLLCLISDATGQIGFTVAPTNSQSDQWQVLVENFITGRKTDFLKYGTTATMDYTFELKAPEWQIAPAFHFMRTHFIHQGHDFEIYTLGLQANFNFTPFKEQQEKEFNNLRFYLQLFPALNYVNLQYTQRNEEGNQPHILAVLHDKKWNFNGGINALLDIRLTNLLTISPLVGIRYFPNLKWDGFTQTISQNSFTNEYNSVNWRHLIIGIRTGLDLHPKKSSN